MMPGYTIEKILGRGGMGAVYKGVQTNLDRTVAIKILPPGVEKEDPSFAERFKNEAKLMAKLLHPAVVAVFDFGLNSGGQLYIAMEYVDGTDVAQMISTQKKLPPDHALAITAHVCDALTAAHELGIVHRDIKPANVLINMKGQVKVADFGLAKIEEPGSHGLTKTGYAMGTPDFVAPEALMLGTAIDGRADVYAVGVMLYQMLTGNIPRGAFKPASVLVPGLDRRYDPIIQKAMQHDREERHQSAAELRRELDVILTVPLVQQEASTGQSAIPAAQVAQVPAQRSAAQKPMGKPPQPKSTTDTPVRQNAAPAGKLRSPEGNAHGTSRPKSKAPLFIGLGAAAALAIGAFVMFSGGKKTPPTAVGDSAPPSKPASMASPPPKPVASTAPKPTPAATSTSSVSSSPSLPIPARNASRSDAGGSPSSDKFPPGQWVKVFMKFEDLPASTRSEDPGLKVTDGWLTPTKDLKISLDSLKARNFGIRAIFKGTAKPILSLGEAGGGSYKFQGPSNNNELLLMDSMSYPETRLASKRLSLQAPQIKEIAMEFYVLSGRCFAKANEVILVHPLTRGTIVAVPGLEGKAPVRDIEVINLDGLSEAEALKILGVDEKGNDLRKPAAVAATAPAPSVSKSPPLPVPASSDPKFPPGQWVKVFTKFEDLPADFRYPGSGVKFEDGWIRCEAGKGHRIYLVDSFSNYAIRTTVLRQTGEYQGKYLVIRGTKGGFDGYTLALGNGFLFAGQKVAGSNVYDHLWKASPPLFHLPGVGEEFTLEFGCVGDKLIGRIGNDFVKVITDTKWNRGSGYISGGEPIRDIEVINLDGLPEAEALRILGINEQGNDLRALATKQEQQMAEQAKAVDAMAAIPELKALHEQFVKLQAERVTAPFEAEVAKLNAGYVGGIDREIANEKKAGHLDGVIALEAEKKLIQGVGVANSPSSNRDLASPAPCPIPAEDAEGTTANLKALRAIYRAAYAKIEATRVANLKQLTDPLTLRLKQLEADLTKKDRVPDAKTVREYRDKVAGGSAVKPEMTATLGGAAAKTQEADKSAGAPLADLKGSSWRKAAEWVISLGGTVEVKHDGKIIRTQKLKDLPSGKFDIHGVELVFKTEAEGERVTDEGLALLAGQKELDTLKISRSPITDAGLVILQNFPKLTVLSIGGKAITSEGIQHLRNPAALKGLSLPGTAVDLELMGDSKLFSSLFSADVSGLKLTPGGFKWITGLTKLSILRANGCEGVTKQTIADLKKLPKLTELHLGNMTKPLTDEDMADIGAFTKLTNLKLPSGLTDKTLIEVAKLSDLVFLEVGGSLGITDAGLVSLEGLKKLTELHIGSGTTITDAGVGDLQKALPNLTINRD